MQCPGQDSRYWKDNAIFEVKCPECSHDIEFFKDEARRRCPSCGYRMLNPEMDLGCAAYCPYAAQCLGTVPGQEGESPPEEALKDRVVREMKHYFETDSKRIGHAERVAYYAGEINRYEQGDAAVILTAAYLHDIGIKNAERKHGSSSPEYQHLEGPPVAQEILERLEADPELIEEVCDIIGHHHHPRQQEKETRNFKVLYDADLIVNLEEKQEESPSPKDHLEKIIRKSFLTDAGRKIAGEALLKE